MAKKAVTFLSGWSRYNVGETAAFEEAQADNLIALKKAKLAKNQPQEVSAPLAVDLDDRQAEAFKVARAQIASAARDVADRESALDVREADLDAREAALTEREKGAGIGDDSGKAESEAVEKGADDGKPGEKAAGLPKQGR